MRVMAYTLLRVMEIWACSYPAAGFAKIEDCRCVRGVSGCRGLFWRKSFRSRALMRIFAGVSMELMMQAQSFQAFLGA